MSTAKKILSNTGVQIIGKAIITIVALFFITRPLTQLGDEFYGQYAFVYRFLGFFAIFADFGLFTIAVREMSADPQNSKKIFRNIFGLRIVLVILVMALAGLAGLGLGYLQPDKFTYPVQLGIWLAGLSVVFTMMATTLASVFQVNYRMLWPTIAEVAGKIAMATIIIWTFGRASGYVSTEDFWLNNFYWFFVAGIVGNFIMLIIRWWKSGEFLHTLPQFDLKFWRKAVRQSLPYGIALIVNAFHFQVDSFMIFIMRAEGAAEVGAYDVAFKVLEILNIIPVYFLNAVLPLLTAVLMFPDKAKKVVDYSWRFLLAISVPLFFGGLVVAPHIIRIIVKNPGEGFFIHSPWVLSVLLLSLVFIFLNSIFGYTLVAQKRHSALLKVNAICLAFNVLANLFAIPYWGFRGAAVTTVLSEALVLILTILAVRKNLKIQIPLLPSLKIILAGGVMALVINAITDQSLLIILPVGGFIYMISLIFFSAIPEEAWGMLRRSEKVEAKKGTENSANIIDLPPE